MHRLGQNYARTVRAMTDQLRKYRKNARFVRRLLLAAGIWPILPKQRATNILYRQIAVLAMFCCTGMCYGLQRFCREHTNNFNVLMKGVSVLASTTLIWLKVILFLKHRRRLSEMLNTLSSLLDDVLQNSQAWSAIFAYSSWFSYSTAFLFYSVFCLGSLYCMTPYVMMMYQFAKSLPRHCTFPYPTSFPWPTENCGFVYKVILILESITSWFFITVTSSVDIFFSYCIFQMSAILRAMSYELGHANAENCEDVLRKCVDRHSALLRCRNILQDTFSAIVLYMSITNAMIMCAVIYQSWQTKLTIANGMLFLVYMLLKLSQAFCYAWYGSILTTESEAFQQAVYFSNWHALGKKSFTNGVFIIISQKPMTITAYSFFPISMQLFTAILNTTTSYFFFLKTLEETVDDSHVTNSLQ